MTASLITDELRALIGTQFEPYVLHVERGDVMRFAQAVPMTSSMFTDELQARHTRFGGTVAPPTYLIVMRILEAKVLSTLWDRIACQANLDGGSIWTFLEPIRPGDRIEARAKLVDLYERDGRVGRMLFAIIEIDYANQFGQLVVQQRDTSIWY